MLQRSELLSFSMPNNLGMLSPRGTESLKVCSYHLAAFFQKAFVTMQFVYKCTSDSSSIEEECNGCKQWKINQTDAAIKSCNYENGTKFNPEPEDTIPSGSKCELHCKVPLILFPSLFYDKNCRTQGRPWMKPDSSF